MSFRYIVRAPHPTKRRTSVVVLATEDRDAAKTAAAPWPGLAVIEVYPDDIHEEPHARSLVGGKWVKRVGPVRRFMLAAPGDSHYSATCLDTQAALALAPALAAERYRGNVRLDEFHGVATEYSPGKLVRRWWWENGEIVRCNWMGCP